MVSLWTDYLNSFFQKTAAPMVSRLISFMTNIFTLHLPPILKKKKKNRQNALRAILPLPAFNFFKISTLFVKTQWANTCYKAAIKKSTHIIMLRSNDLTWVPLWSGLFISNLTHVTVSWEKERIGGHYRNGTKLFFGLIFPSFFK